MYFYIDGYNLLFSWSESHHSLQRQRETFIQWIQIEFHRLDLKGTIVFDGAHIRDEESGLSYPNPLELAFTPKGQSADEYIVEQLEVSKNRALITVVTNDIGLKKHISALRVETMSNATFFLWLEKRSLKKKTKIPFPQETKHQIERLTKIFEEKLKNPEQ